MKTTLDRVLFSLVYIFIFSSAIGRIQYSATTAALWINLYRLSIYLIIFLGIAYILFKHKVRFDKITILICLMVLYEAIISIFQYKRINISLFNEFVIDVLAWPLIFVLTHSFIKDVGIPRSFKKITICGVFLILAITAINLFNMDTMGINAAIGGVTYCVAVLPLMYFFFSKKAEKILTIVVLILVMVSTKRSAFLALLIGVFAYYISDAVIQEISRKKFNKMLSLMLMVFLVSIVGIYLLETSNIDIIQKFTSGDETLSGRTILWERILVNYGNQSFIEKLFGNGMHAVKYKINPYGLGWYAHNSFIETLYDYGVIGLILLILFVVVIIKKTVSMNMQKSKFAPVMSSTIPPLLFYAFSSYFFEVGQMILFYSFIWSLCIAVMDKGDLNQKVMSPAICRLQKL